MAIAILGWPLGKIPESAASAVVDGGRSICSEAGIPLAGGHSIDSPEPIFGLAVTGRVPLAHLQANASSVAGDRLYLTKPLGVGMLTTAEKKGFIAFFIEFANDVIYHESIWHGLWWAIQRPPLNSICFAFIFNCERFHLAFTLNFICLISLVKLRF